MSPNCKLVKFYSPIAPIIMQFIHEKRACGYKYSSAPRVLKHLDIFLCKKKLKNIALPKELILQWLAIQPGEKVSTHQGRISLIRQFAKMMMRLGYPSYTVPDRIGTRRTFIFSPYIFTREEVNRLIQAADQITSTPKSPLRNIIMPEFFRLLYGCGFRLGELLNLRIGDVDLGKGVITVRQGKFGKDRLVPPTIDVVIRLRSYVKKLKKNSLEKITDNSFFFPSSIRTAWSTSGIYNIFRKMLHQCSIQHGGRGKGPRLHDLRHTFAVHRLIKWYEEGADINAKQPLLVAYLGHQDFTGTQKYLHLTAELFPNLIARMSKQFGGVIPQWR